MSREYEVFALKYGTRQTTSAQQYYGANKDPIVAEEMAYYVWVMSSGSRNILFDAGFTAAVGERRGRTHLESPVDMIDRDLGIKAEDIDTVIISHLHYDHTGYVTAFPNARIILQKKEMEFWTGPYASRSAFAGICENDDVLAMVKLNFEGRVQIIDGSLDVASGVSVHLVGGHTPGLQVTQVSTKAGEMVLASDASHYAANVENDRPSASVVDLPDMYYAFDVMRSLASKPELIIPGHDPSVLLDFPAISDKHEGRIVQLG